MFDLDLFFQAFIGVFIVSLLSLSGVVTLVLNKNKLKKTIYYLVSFAIGSLLASVWWHLIPESYESINNDNLIGFLVLAGLFVFLLLEKLIRHHHCHKVNCRQAPAGWLILFSDGLHNLIDGMLIGAGFMTSPTVGWATVIAVAGHEIAQEIGDFSILIHSGFNPKKALLFNFLSGLTAVAGLMIVFGLGTHFNQQIVYLLPFTAGGFLYIALADLVPELHQKRTGLVPHAAQLMFIFLGLAVIFVLK